MVLRTEDAEMTFAEDIRLEDKELRHGFLPLADVRSELFVERTVNILTS